MNAIAIMTPKPQGGLRDRIVTCIKTSRDRETNNLLKEILAHLDKPYDLAWMKQDFNLSPAEYKILNLLVEGKNAAGIHEITGTAQSTIRRQIHDVYKKTGVSNMPELTALLLKRARAS